MRIRRDFAEKMLLTLMFYISLWRSTSMWYGYPARFDEGASVDPLPMKLILYSLIPLLGLYALIKPGTFLRVLRRTPKLVVPLLLLCVIAIALSENRPASLRGAAAVILLTLPPILYRTRYGGPAIYRSLLNFCIIAAYANVVYTAAFPQFAIMRGSYDGMIKGLFYHKNILGQFCAVSFIILLCGYRWPPRLSVQFLLHLGATLLTLGLILVSRSSTAVIIVGVGLGVLGMFYVVQRLGTLFARTVVMSLLTVFLLVLGSAVYIGLIAAIADAFGKDVTFSGRTGIWEQLIPLIFDKPLFGYGFALFRQPEVMAQYVHVNFEARSTHNTYLELALNIGIPATALWVSFMIARLYRKILVIYVNTALRRSQLRDLAVILMVAAGAFMEAGFMLAPLVLWVLLVLSLANSPADRVLEMQTREARAAARPPVEPSRYRRRRARGYTKDADQPRTESFQTEDQSFPPT